MICTATVASPPYAESASDIWCQLASTAFIHPFIKPDFEGDLNSFSPFLASISPRKPLGEIPQNLKRSRHELEAFQARLYFLLNALDGGFDFRLALRKRL